MVGWILSQEIGSRFIMHTFLKTACVLVFGVAGMVALGAWGSGNNLLRVLATPTAILAITGFFILHFRRDLAPDFLRQQCKKFYERNGFCFFAWIDSKDGIAVLNIPFQSRYSKPSLAQIAFRQPNQQPFLTVEIECEPGASGIAHFPVAIPEHYQGKEVLFEIGATVRYPKGKGKMLRFRNGMLVRQDACHSKSWVMTGEIKSIIQQPLPSGVAEELPKGIEPTMETYWKLDDGVLAQKLL